MFAAAAIVLSAFPAVAQVTVRPESEFFFGTLGTSGRPDPFPVCGPIDLNTLTVGILPVGNSFQYDFTGSFESEADLAGTALLEYNGTHRATVNPVCVSTEASWTLVLPRNNEDACELTAMRAGTGFDIFYDTPTPGVYRYFYRCEVATDWPVVVFGFVTGGGEFLDLPDNAFFPQPFVGVLAQSGCFDVGFASPESPASFAISWDFIQQSRSNMDGGLSHSGTMSMKFQVFSSDFNGDGSVGDAFDLFSALDFLAAGGDINLDGVVDVFDTFDVLAILEGVVCE